MKHIIMILVLSTAIGLGGCTKFKKITGQTNDTILPGQREEVLPPDQQTARDPLVTGKEAKPCNPKITTCPDVMAEPDLAPEDMSAQ